jgi:hypothetical protein
MSRWGFFFKGVLLVDSPVLALILLKLKLFSYGVLLEDFLILALGLLTLFMCFLWCAPY